MLCKIRTITYLFRAKTRMEEEDLCLGSMQSEDLGFESMSVSSVQQFTDGSLESMSSLSLQGLGCGMSGCLGEECKDDLTDPYETCWSYDSMKH